jgi:hypothetical protein
VIAHQVEVRAVTIPAAVGRCDAADAGLDQPSGHQQVFVVGIRAVVGVVERLAGAVPLANAAGTSASQTHAIREMNSWTEGAIGRVSRGSFGLGA